MVLNEEKISNIIVEEINKSDLLQYIKHDKEFEKRVKEITSDIIKDMFRVLWQHNNIFKSLGK